ncbi:hypothetical protein PybrP1_006931 [[Pythium] brassicae (nom. inval.)]|nr:hypothetical protein PybrP1_006931 [[Pythium] brassicae (nom. inval.)]
MERTERLACWFLGRAVASTVATIREGKIVVSAVNTTKHRARLPACHVLGDWILLKPDVEALPFEGTLSRDRVIEWLTRVKNARGEPLHEEEKLHLSELSTVDRELLLQLRRFPTLLRKYDSCPPPNVACVVDLAVVFDRLEHAGLTLKSSKRVFVAKEIDYLGHRLTNKGILPQDRLVTVVREFPVPTDAKGVKRFVHLAGYYRWFIPNFRSRAAPMTRLLRKDVEFMWGAEQASAFEDLRRALVEKPLLVYLDLTKSFLLVTDASAVGCGACLLQEYGNGLQPIAYASKVMSPSLWPRVFRECHDSMWSGHLRGPQALARIKQLYWWPRMISAVNDWADACHDCGPRKVRAPQVVPPVRSLGAGAVGDHGDEGHGQTLDDARLISLALSRAAGRAGGDDGRRYGRARDVCTCGSNIHVPSATGDTPANSRGDAELRTPWSWLRVYRTMASQSAQRSRAFRPAIRGRDARQPDERSDPLAVAERLRDIVGMQCDCGRVKTEDNAIVERQLEDVDQGGAVVSDVDSDYTVRGPRRRDVFVAQGCSWTVWLLSYVCVCVSAVICQVPADALVKCSTAPGAKRCDEAACERCMRSVAVYKPVRRPQWSRRTQKTLARYCGSTATGVDDRGRDGDLRQGVRQDVQQSSKVAARYQESPCRSLAAINVGNRGVHEINRDDSTRDTVQLNRLGAPVGCRLRKRDLQPALLEQALQIRPHFFCAMRLPSRSCTALSLQRFQPAPLEC